MSFRKSISIYCLVLICFKGYSQVSFKTEYLGSSDYRLKKGEEPSEKVGDSKGSAIVYQANVDLPVSVKMSTYEKPVVWGVGLSGSYASLKNENFTEDLVISDILNLEAGIYHKRPISRRWSLMASAGIGIYPPSTDFSKIRGKHILGNVSTVFIYQVKPNLELGGGIAVNSTFGYPMAFPALYLNWTSEGKFDFMLSMTNGLNVSAGYNLNRFMKLSLIGEMNGQMALTEKEGKDVIFTHQYIVSGLRTEFRIGEKISIPVTAGINAMRPASFSDRTLKAMFKSDNDYYFQVSPYLSAGVNINF